MKTKFFTLIFITFFTLINAQGVFTWKTSENKPSVVTWDGAGFSALYKYDGSSLGYDYLLMVNADAVSSFSIVQGEGAYTRVFLPPGVAKITFGHNDPTLNASQCVKYSFIGEFALSDNIPAQTLGSETWAWGCGSFNSTFIRDVNNTNNEGVLIAGYYNEDNLHTEGVNFQDYSFTYYVSDSVVYNNWLAGVNCTETITAGEISGSQTICDGDDPDVFTSITPATGNTDLAYQWQYSEDQTTWIDAAGETNETWDLAAVDYGYTTQTDLYGRRKASDCSGDIYSNVITLTVDVCAGINDIQETSFSIYPNPATSQLTINNVQLANDNIKILDITGKVVLVSSLRGGTTNQSVDISDLQNGVYFVKVGNEVKKFVKE